jgi:hypothetical protein
LCEWIPVCGCDFCKGVNVDVWILHTFISSMNFTLSK